MGESNVFNHCKASWIKALIYSLGASLLRYVPWVCYCHFASQSGMDPISMGGGTYTQLGINAGLLIGLWCGAGQTPVSRHTNALHTMHGQSGAG